MNRNNFTYLLALVSSFSLHAQQTSSPQHHITYVRPEYIAFGIAGASALGAYALQRRDRALENKYMCTYNRYNKKGTFDPNNFQYQGIQDFKAETLHCDPQARKRYKYGYYALGVLSLFSGALGSWLLWSKQSPQQ
jgi:hypothetical protein